MVSDFDQIHMECGMTEKYYMEDTSSKIINRIEDFINENKKG